MEPVFYTSAGAAGVVGLIILRLAARHGWTWVEARLRAKASAAESDFKTRITRAVGDIDAKVADVVHSELARIESDIAALKAKAGL
jgi:hypothetical protein